MVPAPLFLLSDLFLIDSYTELFSCFFFFFGSYPIFPDNMFIQPGLSILDAILVDWLTKDLALLHTSISLLPPTPPKSYFTFLGDIVLRYYGSVK